MGNHCCGGLSRGTATSEAPDQQAMHNITVVVAADGRVAEVEVPSLQASCMKVGELLLEFPPGHFVARFARSFFDASANGPSERASPLGADADAFSGAAHVYVLFPMPRLHTHLTPQERKTFARLLQDHICPEDHKLDDSASARQRSLVKQFCSLIRGRAAARVVPLVPQEDSESADSQQQGSTILKEEQYTGLIREQVQMIKAKPWAPRLDSISEGGEEFCS